MLNYFKEPDRFCLILFSPSIFRLMSGGKRYVKFLNYGSVSSLGFTHTRAKMHFSSSPFNFRPFVVNELQQQHLLHDRTKVYEVSWFFLESLSNNSPKSVHTDIVKSYTILWLYDRNQCSVKKEIRGIIICNYNQVEKILNYYLVVHHAHGIRRYI